METLCIFLFFALAALIATIFWPFETDDQSLPGPNYP